MGYITLIVILAVLEGSYPLNPEILKYDQYMKDFQTTGQQIKQEAKDKSLERLSPLSKRESSITSRNSDKTSTMKNFTPFHSNSSSEHESQKFKTSIIPIITNVKHTQAMEKLRDLWVTQQEYFEKAKKAIRELCNKTDQAVEPMDYLLEDIDPLLERQVRVLTKLPWRNTDEVYEAVDDGLIDQQRQNWEVLGLCMEDQYDYLSEDHKSLERDVRRLFDTARNNLLNRRDEVISLERSAQEHDGVTVEYGPFVPSSDL